MLINVDKYSLNPKDIDTGTRGSYGIEEMEFQFSSDWDNAIICVYFFPPRSVPVAVIYTGRFAIPIEIMRVSGKHQYVVAGYLGDKRILSVTGNVNVLHTIDVTSASGFEATPGQAEQLIQLASEAKAAAEEVLRRADAGEFKGDTGATGAIGPIGQTGPAGSVGATGKSIQIIWNGTQLGVRVEGDSQYQYVDLKGERGEQGFQGIQGIQGIQGLQGSSLSFNWIGAELGVRVGDSGEYTYTNLKGDRGEQGIQGETGESLEFQWNGTELGVRVGNSGTYTYMNLKGEKGDTGKGFTVYGYYSTVSALESAVTSPESGEAYGIGSSEPYDIYIYDGISGNWINNGRLQGVAGEDGKSLEFQWNSTELGVRVEGESTFQYIDLKGARGDDGESSYIHIRYGDSPTPTNLSVTPMDYMGVYTGTSETAPQNYSDYTWYKIKGEQGTSGTDGTSYYVHIRWGTSDTPAILLTTPADYIGIYTGTLPTAPNTYNGYTWYKIKGEQGVTGSTGATGANGKSAYQSAVDGGYTGTEAQFNADLGAIGNVRAVLDAINGEVI